MMRRVNATILATVLIYPILFGATQAADVEGSQDHPLLAQRYEGSEITRYEQQAFDELPLLVMPASHSGV